MSDDWADDGSPSQRNELDREWDLRREQHYNVSRLWGTVFNSLAQMAIVIQVCRVDIEKVLIRARSKPFSKALTQAGLPA